MRRLLPLFLCVAASTGLTACDDQPVVGPTNTDEQALYDFFRGAASPDAPGLTDEDVTLTRYDLDDPIEPIIIVVIDNASYRGDGELLQTLSGSAIAAPDGEVLCTMNTSGPFTQLVAADGSVLFSVMGPWVFDGAPDLSGDAGAQFQSLMSSLRFSFSFDELVDGMPSSGDTVISASAPVQFSSDSRRLHIASLAEGYCGAESL